MKRFLLLLPLACLVWVGCSAPDDAPEASAPTTESGLTAAQLENGIGPITTVQLGELDAALAARGEAAYTTKCSACHKLEGRYVGPPLGNILDLRTPEYVMNMMLNPAEMVEKHPEARAMLAQFMTPMPNQNLTEDEARAILEYLRQVQPKPQS